MIGHYAVERSPVIGATDVVSSMGADQVDRLVDGAAKALGLTPNQALEIEVDQLDRVADRSGDEHGRLSRTTRIGQENGAAAILSVPPSNQKDPYA